MYTKLGYIIIVMTVGWGKWKQRHQVFKTPKRLLQVTLLVRQHAVKYQRCSSAERIVHCHIGSNHWHNCMNQISVKCLWHVQCSHCRWYSLLPGGPHQITAKLVNHVNEECVDSTPEIFPFRNLANLRTWTFGSSRSGIRIISIVVATRRYLLDEVNIVESKSALWRQGMSMMLRAMWFKHDWPEWRCGWWNQSPCFHRTDHVGICWPYYK